MNVRQSQMLEQIQSKDRVIKSMRKDRTRLIAAVKRAEATLMCMKKPVGIHSEEGRRRGGPPDAHERREASEDGSGPNDGGSLEDLSGLLSTLNELRSSHNVADDVSDDDLVNHFKTLKEISDKLLAAGGESFVSGD